MQTLQIDGLDILSRTAQSALPNADTFSSSLVRRAEGDWYGAPAPRAGKSTAQIEASPVGDILGCKRSALNSWRRATMRRGAEM